MDRRHVDSHDGGVGGIGSVWGRGSSTKMYGANVPTQQAVKVGGESLAEVTSHPVPLCFQEAHPRAPPPIHGATSPTCRRRLQTLMVMLGEYCGDTEKRESRQDRVDLGEEC